MKRYTITADVDAEAVTVPSKVRTKIVASPNGEWCRYEDVKQFVDLASRVENVECYCEEFHEPSDVNRCVKCKFDDEVEEFNEQT